MAFGFQPRKGVGVFGPRVVIYTIAILAMAWLMWRYDRNVQEERASREALRSNAPEVIESTLVGNEPMLLLLSEDNEATSGIAADIREGLSGKCRFAHLYVAGEMDISSFKGTFKVDNLPAAILFDANNRELGRVEGEITLEKVEGLVNLSSKDSADDLKK